MKCCPKASFYFIKCESFFLNIKKLVKSAYFSWRILVKAEKYKVLKKIHVGFKLFEHLPKAKDFEFGL